MIHPEYLFPRSNKKFNKPKNRLVLTDQRSLKDVKFFHDNTAVQRHSYNARCKLSRLASTQYSVVPWEMRPHIPIIYCSYWLAGGWLGVSLCRRCRCCCPSDLLAGQDHQPSTGRSCRVWTVKLEPGERERERERRVLYYATKTTAHLSQAWLS